MNKITREYLADLLNKQETHAKLYAEFGDYQAVGVGYTASHDWGYIIRNVGVGNDRESSIEIKGDIIPILVLYQSQAKAL